MQPAEDFGQESLDYIIIKFRFYCNLTFIVCDILVVTLLGFQHKLQ